MIGCDTAVFTYPDDYGMSVPGASIRLVLTGCRPFKARRTWVHIRRLSLVRSTEAAPRVAFIVPAPGAVLVSFPLRHQPPPIWSGVEIRPGELVFHGRGAPMHQRTDRATRWGFIALAAEDLASCARGMARVELKLPQTAKIIRPASTFTAELLRQHGDVCRTAETKPCSIMRGEAARALEQNLLRALIDCLTAEEGCELTGARQHRAQIMARFEDVLACHGPLEPPMPELADAVGTPDRYLRSCCAEFLGMSPGQYAHLRRLNLVRLALRRADSATATVKAIAGQYGFSELGRFAGEYRTTFGELPSATLSGVRCTARDARSSKFA